MTYVLQGVLKVKDEKDAAFITPHKTIFLTPKKGWKPYLDEWLANDDLLEGKVEVWEQTRVPLPWMYCYAVGAPIHSFEYLNGTFVEGNVRSEEKQEIVGLGVDVFGITCKLLYPTLKGFKM